MAVFEGYGGGGRFPTASEERSAAAFDMLYLFATGRVLRSAEKRPVKASPAAVRLVEQIGGTTDTGTAADEKRRAEWYARYADWLVS